VALPRASQDVIDQFLREHEDEVAARMRALAMGGLASNGRSGLMFVGWAYDVEEAAKIRGQWAWNVNAGVPLQKAPPNSVLVGNAFAGLLDCTMPDGAEATTRDGRPIVAERPFSCRQPRLQLTATTESGQLNAIDPMMVGTFNAGLQDIDAKFVHLPLALGQRLLDTDAVSFYSIALKDPSQADRFVAELNATAAARGVDVDAMRWDQHKYSELYRRGMQVLGLYRTFVILIVVAIAGMSVFSTMLKAVNERVREIGTLRSVGYRRRHIGALFTVEAALLAGVASVVGVLLSAIAVAAINAGGFSYKAGLAAQAIPLTVSLLPGVCAFAAGFLGTVAVVAAALPARRAARLGIPDALGHAG
jgi:putative ABC transport system permease protein